MGGAKVVCLLPARNAAGQLAGWFESVERFADGVVALDDGSTDGTGKVLAGHPLVMLLERNPARPDHTGWDDSRNRNRLLAAAASVAPQWIVSIDADELVPPEDGDALRRFIDEQAVAGVGYGFRRYRMIGDTRHYDVLEDRVYRLFAHRAGQGFPRDRLHFAPVPTTIPPCRWLASNIRIQHLAGLTAADRRLRREKYRQADPDRHWERDYSYIEAAPGLVREWQPRRRAEPVILESYFNEWRAAVSEPGYDAGWPVLSVVVLVEDGQIDDMLPLLDEVARERRTCHHPTEVLVLAVGPDSADDAARLVPAVSVIEVSPHLSFGARLNVGVRAARGDYVLCLDAPGRLEDGAFDAVIAAHDKGCAVVSCAADVTERTLVGWSSYLGGSWHGSFTREALLAVGGFDAGLPDGVEALARDRLIARGHRVASTHLVRVGGRSRLRTPSAYLRARFSFGWERSRGAIPAGASGTDLAGLAGAWRAQSGAVGDGALRRAAPLALGGLAAAWAGSRLERLARVMRR